ncbi:MAG: molybdopterin molybdotransferase MoeA, partial [Bdellovibrionota bacterium]
RVAGLKVAGDSQITNSDAYNWESLEIMTGSPLPQGGILDCVVKVEETHEEWLPDGMRLVFVTRPIESGENVRGCATDFRKGKAVLEPGDVIQAETVMALAALGIGELSVVKRPKLAFVSTGNELAPFGEPRLAPGMIRNSSGPFLALAVQLAGCEILDLGCVRDDSEMFIQACRRAMEWGADVILSTGAVSMGIHDFVGGALDQMGAIPHFHKCAIRPGKPILFAEFGPNQPVFFGLPGNPVSTAVGFRFFVQPYLRGIQGLPVENSAPALLVESFPNPPGLRCFFKAMVSELDGTRTVRVLKGQGSYQIHPLLKANAWVEFEEQSERIEAGAKVGVYGL